MRAVSYSVGDHSSRLCTDDDDDSSDSDDDDATVPDTNSQVGTAPDTPPETDTDNCVVCVYWRLETHESH